MLPGPLHPFPMRTHLLAHPHYEPCPHPSAFGGCRSILASSSGVASMGGMTAGFAMMGTSLFLMTPRYLETPPFVNQPERTPHHGN